MSSAVKLFGLHRDFTGKRSKPINPMVVTKTFHIILAKHTHAHSAYLPKSSSWCFRIFFFLYFLRRGLLDGVEKASNMKLFICLKQSTKWSPFLHVVIKLLSKAYSLRFSIHDFRLGLRPDATALRDETEQQSQKISTNPATAHFKRPLAN